MTALPMIRQLHRHLRWADARIQAAWNGTDPAPAQALREYAHILGAEEIWLARLEGRPARTAVWPDPQEVDLEDLARRLHAGWTAYLEGLEEEQLGVSVAYRNSAGHPYRSSVAEILLQVFLHGQYHRGRVNLLLRQADLEPVPADFIAFARGAAKGEGEQA